MAYSLRTLIPDNRVTGTLMVVTQVENNCEGCGGDMLKESDFAITVSGNNPSPGQNTLVMSAGPVFPQ